MKLFIIDNKDFVFKKFPKNFIYINENLQNRNSIKFYIEKDKKIIRREISILIKGIMTKKFRKFNSKKEDNLIWEMSSVFEMNSLRTNSFYKLAQLICLKNLIKSKKIKYIYYYGIDENIINFLKNTKLFVKIINSPTNNVKKKGKDFNFIKGLGFYLKYIYTNFSLILSKKKKNQFDSKSLILISYLVHLDKKKKIIYLHLIIGETYLILLKKMDTI